MMEVKESDFSEVGKRTMRLMRLMSCQLGLTDRFPLDVY